MLLDKQANSKYSSLAMITLCFDKSQCIAGIEIQSVCVIWKNERESV